MTQLSSALTRQGNQFDALVRDALPLSQQLAGGGFCGVAAYDGPAQDAASDALVQVTGTFSVQLPSQVTATALLPTTPDRTFVAPYCKAHHECVTGTGCAPSFDMELPGEADMQPGLCNPQPTYGHVVHALAPSS